MPVVLDEFSYLVTASPSLPSLLQAALSPARRRSTPTRLVVCGSAMSLMGSLLTANAPLRGRAGLELVVHAFDYRTAAAFWGLEDQPAVAFSVFAVLGGTPAYAREFVREDVPADSSDVERWLAERVLDPASPLFREGRTLLAEDPELATVRDRGLYHSVLAAVAGGNRTTSHIASYVRRSSDQLAHPLAVLVEGGFLDRADDPLRRGRPQYRVAEPIVRFHHAVMRPRWAALQRRAIDWPRIYPTLRSQVLGPASEELARTWTERFAAAATMGGDVELVGHTAIISIGSAGYGSCSVRARCRDADSCASAEPASPPNCSPPTRSRTPSSSTWTGSIESREDAPQSATSGTRRRDRPRAGRSQASGSRSHPDRRWYRAHHRLRRPDLRAVAAEVATCFIADLLSLSADVIADRHHDRTSTLLRFKRSGRYHWGGPRPGQGPEESARPGPLGAELVVRVDQGAAVDTLTPLRSASHRPMLQVLLVHCISGHLRESGPSPEGEGGNPVTVAGGLHRAALGPGGEQHGSGRGVQVCDDEAGCGLAAECDGDLPGAPQAQGPFRAQRLVEGGDQRVCRCAIRLVGGEMFERDPDTATVPGDGHRGTVTRHQRHNR